MMPMGAAAQLSSNPDKFIGNITTRYQMDAGEGLPQFYKLWNQVTCENESKWGSVEVNRGSYNWGGDRAFDYAKQHKFTYKFHALVWGAQYPGWLPSLSPKDRFAAIVSWFDAVKKKYPTSSLLLRHPRPPCRSPLQPLRTAGASRLPRHRHRGWPQGAH